MRPAENIKRIFKNASVGTNPKADDEILKKLIQTHRQAANEKHVRSELNTWRIIMQSKITKLATAAVIAIAAVLGITFLGQSVPAAYALEQTIQANHSVRFLHIKEFVPDQDEPKEFWVQCDEFGNITNARMHFPEWSSPEDGAKVTLWQNDKVQVYFKRKNIHFIANEQKVAQMMLGLILQADPRFAVEQLRELEAKGEMKISIETPTDKAEPTVVTATHTQRPQKLILFVDQATKLVTVLETYGQTKQGYELISTQEYYDYNIPIDEKIFTFEGELPEDVVKIDQTTQEVGLVQGNMTDEEIAVEVARQFFEALIAEDYAKAGQLLEGTPADYMKKIFGPMKFLRVISVGPVEPHPNPATRGVVVPVTVEFEKEGQLIEHTFEQLGVRQVYNQPGRWTIFGGI